MGHWTHRVVRRTHPSTEVSYGIHEAYYGIEEKPLITEEPVAAYGETLDELKEELEHMLRACSKPVLDYDTREEV